MVDIAFVYANSCVRIHGTYLDGVNEPVESKGLHLEHTRELAMGKYLALKDDHK